MDGLPSVCPRRRHLGRKSPDLYGEFRSSLGNQDIADRPPTPFHFSSRLKQFCLARLDPKRVPTWSEVVAELSRHLPQSLYSDDFAKSIDGVDPLAGFRAAYAACGSSDPLDRALYLDVKTYLVDDILTKVDKMSMAVSLEARVPLLDHKLLEFVATVPTALKIKNGRRKYLLRRLLERRVPKTIVDRPKHGFEAPTGAWLKGPLAPMVDALLLDGRLRDRGIFDHRAVASIWCEHRDGDRDHRHRLWNLVMLELWFRQFIDSARPAEAGVAA